MNYEESLARIAVPRLADWCAIDLLDNAAVRRIADTHTDVAEIERAAPTS